MRLRTIFCLWLPFWWFFHRSLFILNEQVRLNGMVARLLYAVCSVEANTLGTDRRYHESSWRPIWWWKPLLMRLEWYAVAWMRQCAPLRSFSPLTPYLLALCGVCTETRLEYIFIFLPCFFSMSTKLTFQCWLPSSLVLCINPPLIITPGHNLFFEI
jgi:hypothetical protein